MAKRRIRRNDGESPAKRVDRPGRTPRVRAGLRPRKIVRTPEAQSAPLPVEELVKLVPVRIGHGWDLHRLDDLMPRGKGRPVVIGGVHLGAIAGKSGHELGVVARSDGDVLLHAITDALLGALALPDIGQLFPDTDSSNEARDSSEFLAEALKRVRQSGYSIANLDATVICQKPRLGPIKEQIRLNLAKLLLLSPDRINVKGKTHEQVDAVGELRAIEAHAVVLLVHAIKS